MRPLIGADGAGSVVRAAMVGARPYATRARASLEHGYKELVDPARARGGGHRLGRDALHIWPRGGFMLIALPNTDGSFTATLFLPRAGAVSFAALGDAPARSSVLAREFPDAAR